MQRSGADAKRRKGWDLFSVVQEACAANDALHSHPEQLLAANLLLSAPPDSLSPAPEPEPPTANASELQRRRSTIFAALHHGLHNPEAPFAPQATPASAPMLWNLLDCSAYAIRTADPAVSTPRRVEHPAPSPVGHRAGCLPAALLLCCPAVSATYLSQACNPGAAPAQTAPDPHARLPVDELTPVEGALLTEAALSAAWRLGPTDSSLLSVRCSLTTGPPQHAQKMTVALTKVQTCLSVYAVTHRIHAYTTDGAVELSLELANCGVCSFDLPSVLFVLDCSPRRLCTLIDAYTHSALKQEALEDIAAQKKEHLSRGLRACRQSRLSVAPQMPWLREAPPEWQEQEYSEEHLNLMLMPVDPLGAPPSLY